MNSLAFRTFAYKSLKSKPLTTALTFCIQTTPWNRLVYNPTVMDVTNKFYKFPSLSKGA